VNRTANRIVRPVPRIAPLRLPSISAWCPYVTVAPDDSRRTVLSRGIANGLSASIPAGGHEAPISTVGARAEWKSLFYRMFRCMHQ